MKTKIIETQCYQDMGDQSLHFKRTVKVDNHKLMVHIRRNAYDFQSWAKVKRWDGTQWHEVHSVPITSCLCSRLSYVHRDVKAESFEADYEMLMRTALQIVIS